MLGINPSTLYYQSKQAPCEAVLPDKIEKLALQVYWLMNALKDGHRQDPTQFHLPIGAIARLGKGIVNDIAYSPEGDCLAVASYLGIWLYDVRSGKERDLLLGHESAVTGVAFSPDGKTLASVG